MRISHFSQNETKGASNIKFKQKRLEAGLKQWQVAEALGIDQATVHLWEAGKTKPRAALLPKVAKLYGCTIDQLLEE